MIDKNIIKTISDKEMDRKDFLKYSGLALLSVVGLKTIATLITQTESKKLAESNTKSARGYGGGKYGV